MCAREIGREREGVCVCAREIGSERERGCMCVRERDRERERGGVCVCAREIGRERERERYYCHKQTKSMFYLSITFPLALIRKHQSLIPPPPPPPNPNPIFFRPFFVSGYVENMANSCPISCLIFNNLLAAF